MKNRLKWVDGYCFMSETASGHALVMDAAVESGGRNRGARPMELILHGVAGCMAYTVMSILKRAKQDICECWVDVRPQRADRHPKVYTEIHLHMYIIGRNLSNCTVEKAFKLSSEKYSSALAMLSDSVKISCSYDLKEMK